MHVFSPAVSDTDHSGHDAGLHEGKHAARTIIPPSPKKFSDRIKGQLSGLFDQTDSRRSGARRFSDL